jgi:hypothetical protein
LYFIILTLILLLLPDISTAKTSPIFAVNGFVDFSVASRNQASAFEEKTLPDQSTTNRLSNSQAIGIDSQIFFKTTKTTKNLTKYGAVAKAEFNANSDRRNENPNLDQAFLFSENSLGKLEFGNNQAVNQKMKTGPARLARAAGGINGKYLENVNLPMLSGSAANAKLPRFILLAQSPIGHGGYAKGFYRSGADSVQSDFNSFNRSNFRSLKDDSFDGVEDATKISYYTPRIEGLQLGVSYAPSSANSGITSEKYFNVDAIRVGNIFSFAANYSEDFDNLAVEFSATAEKGQTKNSKSTAGVERANLSSYDLAANFSYFGFTFGASYGSWGKSLQPKNGIYSCDYDSTSSLASQSCTTNAKKFRDPGYYSAGISYAFGPIAASITGLRSQFQKNYYQAVSLGVDYKLSRVVMPYFELTKFAFESNQLRASDITSQSSIKDNRGYVFLTGILISF